MRLIKLFIFFFICSVRCYGAVVFTDSMTQLAVGNQVFFLKSNKEISFSEAVASKKFMPLHDRVSNLGSNAHSVWLKISISNQSRYDNLLLDIAYPILDEVELFTPDATGHYQSVLMGEKIPFKDRHLQHPDPVFDLDLLPGQTKTYYLRVKSSEQIILPISVVRPVALWKDLNEKNFFVGIYIGIILIMGIYNLFLYLSIKDRSYLYYVIYVFFVGLTQVGIEGYTYEYLWPGNSAFELRSIQLFACIGSIAALLFAHHFLRIKKEAPILGRFLMFGIGVFAVAFFLSLSSQWVQLGFEIMQFNTMVFSVFVLCLSFYIMLKGYQPARFFFIAWSLFIAGSIIFLLKDYNILPYNNFTRYSVKLSSSLEIALLSFGLANRINRLKKERDVSRLLTLKTARENERIIKQQNIILEENVNKRTEELRHKNEILNKTYEDLKQTQTQLVAAEKMSSLGQLTAGIAHEINNPINFVAANINPLKRDINQLFDTIVKIEKIADQDISPEAKKLEITKYKEEQDFDYVQMEIAHLLKGIHEGASRTADIVKGLRTFSRLDEGDLKSADINDGLSSTLTISSNLLKGIEVNTQFGDIPFVTCYPGKLNQVFLNIITNAIFAIRKKHGNNEGGTLTIKTYREDKFVFISIKDDGIGMDEATKTKLFEPFFTTKNVGEGTGLGMSIAFAIIQEHHGTLYIDSELGKGSEFILRLPIQHVEKAKKSVQENA